LLAAALDNGLRLAATVHSSDGAGRIGGDLALARHLVAHRVDLPSFQQLEEVLQRYAATSSTPVAAAAIQTAIALSQDEPIANPAAAVGLLSAAIAEAEWRGAPHVGPDDVFAGRRDDYFEVDD
jgi:hypothetical protein